MVLQSEYKMRLVWRQLTCVLVHCCTTERYVQEEVWKLF